MDTAAQARPLPQGVAAVRVCACWDTRPCTRQTEKPLSSLWNVTRSTAPMRGAHGPSGPAGWIGSDLSTSAWLQCFYTAIPPRDPPRTTVRHCASSGAACAPQRLSRALRHQAPRPVAVRGAARVWSPLLDTARQTVNDLREIVRDQRQRRVLPHGLLVPRFLNRLDP
jgi:hypothetical protein